jgi:tetratricopeptide (TPR) repeat protein
MKTIYLKLFFLLFLVLTVMGASSQNKKMPVTSNSAKAVAFYQQAVAAMDNADFAPAIDLLKKALKEDPNFFLSQYHLAINSEFLGRPDEYWKYAEMAISNPSKLSEAELLLKTTLEKRMADPKVNTIDIWEKLAEMYPKDPEPYYNWGMSLVAQGNRKEAIDIFKKILEFTDKPATTYNLMGYAYMNMKDYANAEKSFDKYIQLEPNHPNPYDSKGDYYMEIKDYGNAYKSYMDAYERNANWSYDKAQKARKLMETASSGAIDSKNLQGSWQLAGGWFFDNNGKRTVFQAGDPFNQVKVWSGKQFICVGKYKDGDHYVNNFACGTFALDGKRYSEDIKYHVNPDDVGNVFNMSMEIKGDTLIQAWPADAMGNVDKNKSICEKYVRMK